MNSDINFKIDRKTVKLLSLLLFTSGGSYVGYDKLWAPYKKIQEEKSIEFVHEMQMNRFEISRLIYEMHVNTLVNAGYNYDEAIEQANEDLN